MSRMQGNFFVYFKFFNLDFTCKHISGDLQLGDSFHRSTDVAHENNFD